VNFEPPHEGIGQGFFFFFEVLGQILAKSVTNVDWILVVEMDSDDRPESSLRLDKKRLEEMMGVKFK
jgi:hypothetical protein